MLLLVCWKMPQNYIQVWDSLQDFRHMLHTFRDGLEMTSKRSAFLLSVHIFRLHRMHDLQSIVTDVRGVCLSVCLSRMYRMTPARLHCARAIGGGACSERRVPSARGHWVQPLSNYFGHLLNIQQYRLLSYLCCMCCVCAVVLTLPCYTTTRQCSRTTTWAPRFASSKTTTATSCRRWKPRSTGAITTARSAWLYCN